MTDERTNPETVEQSDGEHVGCNAIVTPLDDVVVAGDVCECEFSPYDDEDAGQESFHFKRRCKSCLHVWYGLHCPHDGNQNPCPACGTIPITVAG